MKTQKQITRRKWLLYLILLCFIASGGLGSWLLTANAQTARSSNNLKIDDFSRARRHTNSLIWSSITGQTEESSPIGANNFVQESGRSCLKIKELVPRNNSVTLVGTKPVLDTNSNVSTAGHEGIYLRAKGTPGQVALGMWIESEQNGRQLYQAQIELKNRWQELRLPLRVFRSVPLGTAANDREVFRIVTFPNMQQRTVEIFLDEIGFYKERTMYNKLTRAQQQIIIRKGTERPFTGKYNDHYEKGTYTCARCDAKLYESSSKFKSGCGWPSFDDEIPGAVKKQRDADGVRTEMLCNNCGGHLGHVFFGEQMTPKNTRHCVNSLSMNFIPAAAEEQEQAGTGTAKAIFASGCFWGTEYYFNKAPGVISTTVGYTGGHVDNPTYKQVCTDKTGHAEAVEVTYDPNVISYEQLAKLFFETHDYTQLNRQGPDIGTQYRTEIFYLDEEQKQIAGQLIQTLKQKRHSVKTKVTKAGTFWPAEEYHQDYYDKTKKLPYCHVYRKIF
ncbi:MAG: bifunctional methionine sulfoxide reductase B/A protein [Sedimentisphaerales bacterium]|nr:bifunctional methionine sulfoxide reductase B/A protein [Sedimentisphaerales bacterium]